MEFDNGTAGAVFTPTSDYSYIVDSGEFVANPHITGYVSGTLAWGEEP